MHARHPHPLVKGNAKDRPAAARTYGDRIEFCVLTRCTWALVFACAVAVAAARALPADAQPTSARDVARTSLPVADAGPEIAARIFDAITIDGSASHDTVPPTAEGAGLITFHWRIAAAPAGSRAAIDPASPAPSFTPDVPGRYVAELIVSGTDGVSSAPARVSVVAYAQDAAPVADAGRDRIVGVDDDVELDGDGSYDPDGVPLTFAWSFASVPAGSALNDRALVGAAGPAAHFAPDVEGRYVVELRVGNGRLTSVARTTVTAVVGNIAPVASIRATVHGGGIDLDGSASVDCRMTRSRRSPGRTRAAAASTRAMRCSSVWFRRRLPFARSPCIPVRSRRH